jgi:hypothetical protein
MPRPPGVEARNWPGRKPGKYEWYEIQDTVDYFQEFEKPKILYPFIASESRFAYDSDGVFFANTGYFLGVDDLYLLALLNSKLIFQYFKRHSEVLGDADKGGRLLWYNDDVLRLPIRRINEKVGADRKARDQAVSLAKNLIALHKQMADATPREACDLQDEIARDQASLDTLVYSLYGLTEEEIQILGA